MFFNLIFLLTCSNLMSKNVTITPPTIQVKEFLLSSFRINVFFAPFFLTIAEHDVNFIREFFILLFLILSVFFSLIVLTASNPIFSALSLMATYVFSGLLLICLDLEIYGIYFILIYAGAISVLILFVVMMINLRFKEKTQPESYGVNLWIKMFFSLVLFLTIITFHFGLEHFASFLGYAMFGLYDLYWTDPEFMMYTHDAIKDVGSVFPMLFTTDYRFILSLSLMILSIGMVGASFLVLSTKK